MPVITLDQWMEAARAAVPAHRQSQALAEVTLAFRIYTERVTTTHLDSLSRVFEVWRTAGPMGERTALAQAAEDLADTIRAAQLANRVIVTRASNVGQSPYYDLITPLRADMPGLFTVLGRDQRVMPLAPGDIHKINEAFARARRAAEYARDAMVDIATRRELTRPLSRAEGDYVDYFGEFHRDRAQAVLQGFRDIVDAFDQRIMVYDVRNTVFGMSCFAACEVGRIARTTARQGSRVTSRVTMVIGRGFFSRSVPRRDAAGGFSPSVAFDATSDATIGTIVHELAHGCFHAIDAPKVDDSGNWELQPNLTPGDWYGATPDNDEQSSTPEADRRVALKDPDIAIRNADSYGQFARQCLQARGG
jgi:hypothetical protein